VRRREKEKERCHSFFFVKFHCRESGEVGGLECKVVVAFGCEMNGGDLKCGACAPSAHVHFILFLFYSSPPCKPLTKTSGSSTC
jgi:hypothetical protein